MAEHPVLAAVAPVGRDHLAAVAAAPEDADDALGGAVEPAQDLGLDFARFAPDQARGGAVSRRKLFAGRADQSKQRRVSRA